MPEEIIVEVRFPPLNETYDFLVPVSLNAEIAARLMAQAIVEGNGQVSNFKETRANGVEIDPEKQKVNYSDYMLFDLDNKKMLTIGTPISAANVTDGTRLLLV
ncbi:MAG: hypothetical protein LBC41_15170 [Clostridiales bacterium]|nr:hypothetical protein [Clostridiales bacterium]MDR2751994.1 hypothetical protein [Clostridiales bacterium]